jgi:hypothetical protein
MIKTEPNHHDNESDEFEDATDTRQNGVAELHVAVSGLTLADSQIEPKSPMTDHIQITDSNEEVKTFDAESAAKFTWKGDISAGPYSFADCRDERQEDCPPPLYFNE